MPLLAPLAAGYLLLSPATVLLYEPLYLGNKSKLIFQGESKIGEKGNIVRLTFLFLSILLVLLPAQASDDKVALYYFWLDGCPACAKEKILIEKLKKEYPQLRVLDFEVRYSVENQTLFRRFLDAHNVSKPYGVPTTFIGKEYLVYDTAATNGVRMENLVRDCIRLGCPDAGEGIIAPAPTTTTPGFEALLGILVLLAMHLKRRKW